MLTSELRYGDLWSMREFNHFDFELNGIIRANNVPELLPITLDAEDVVPATSPRSQPVAAAAPESLNISCEVTFRHEYQDLPDGAETTLTDISCSRSEEEN